jgi:deoxyribodipyrimidine photo-lyase
MNYRYKKSLFIFRRDMRLSDNTALHEALKDSQTVIPCFIFDPQQVGSENKYRSNRCIMFMIQSLEDLQEQLHAHKGTLYCFNGKTCEVVDHLIRNLALDAIYINRDYTPFAQARDGKLADIAKKYTIAFHAYDDALLNAPGSLTTISGKPYIKFTPYYNNARQKDIPQSITHSDQRYWSKPIQGTHSLAHMRKSLELPTTTTYPGGRTAATTIVRNLKKLAAGYAYYHDFPGEDRTTHLSAHLKFTTYSPRELYYILHDYLPQSEPLIRQLYWRDFFTHIGWAFPHVLGSAFHEKYNAIHWSYDHKNFERWYAGETGFPIVDAGMRQLAETGWMHNRVRLVTASFLTKDLHIDWRWGERFFAQSLVDYDPLVNNGNWQWVAGSGCDAQPYFRIFNPWLQQRRYDPDAVYIKRWIPELRSIPARTIHTWYEASPNMHNVSYPIPMVDHHHASQEMLAKIQQTLKRSSQ